MRASKEYWSDLSLYNKLDDWDNLSEDEQGELRANYAIDVCVAVCRVREYPEAEALFAEKLAESEDSLAEFDAEPDEVLGDTASKPNWQEEGF